MTDRQIEEKVKAVFTSDIPDNFDVILEKCKAKEKIIAMPKESKWNKKLMMRAISTAAVVVVVFTAGLVGFHFTKDDLDNSGGAFFEEDEITQQGDKDSINNSFFEGDNIVGDEGDYTDDNNDDTNSDATSSNDKDTTNSGDDQNDNNVDLPDSNNVAGTSWRQMLAAMPKKLRGSTITVYNWNSETEYIGAPAVIDEFTKQTGIKVNWQTISYESYFTKLSTVIASGKNIPDVVRTRGPVPEHMLSYQPLSAAKFNFADEAWDKEIMDLYTINGRAYATSLQNTHIGSVDLLFYNKSLIEKYDLEDPYKLWKKNEWNWDKYLEMCREYKNLTGNPASCGEGWYSSYPSALGIQGAIAFDGRKFYNNMTDKNFLTVHQTLGDLYNVEKIFELGESDLFNDGKRLFSIGDSSQMRRKNSYFTNLKSQNTLYAVPMPARKGERYVQGIAEAEAYAIAKGASNPEAAPYFLRCFLDSASYDLNTYFCNRQNLEVYNWCINQKNKNFVFEYPQEIGASDSTGILGQTGDQMKNYIDSKMDAVDKVVKAYNSTLKKLNK